MPKAITVEQLSVYEHRIMTGRGVRSSNNNIRSIDGETSSQVLLLLWKGAGFITRSQYAYICVYEGTCTYFYIGIYAFFLGGVYICVPILFGHVNFYALILCRYACVCIYCLCMYICLVSLHCLQPDIPILTTYVNTSYVYMYLYSPFLSICLFMYVKY